MARVALVTGGTRGIGAAVSRALKDAGYAVAATYAGNTKAAETLFEVPAAQATNSIQELQIEKRH